MGFENNLSQGGEMKKSIKPLKDNVELYIDSEGKTRHRFIGEPMEGYDEPSEKTKPKIEGKIISPDERKIILNEAKNTEEILKAFDTNEMIIGHDRAYNPEYFKELVKGIIDSRDEKKLQFIEDIDGVLHDAIKRVIKKELSEARNNFS
jgi:hypothetical protein